MADVRLTKTERIALRDCSQFPAGSYTWKPATMRRLAAKGLVEAVPANGRPKTTACRLTALGRHWLDGV